MGAGLARLRSLTWSHDRPSPFAICVERGADPSTFLTSDGDRHCVIATGAQDLLEASPETRGRLVSRFEDALATLEVRAQVLVTSRRTAPGDVADPRLRQYLQERVEPRGFERRIHWILSDGGNPLADRIGRLRHAGAEQAAGPGALVRAAQGLVQSLGAMGLGPVVMEGRALDRFLDQHLPHVMTRAGSAAAWRETPGALELDGCLHRSLYLDSYPGIELEPGWIASLLDVDLEYDLAMHVFKVPPASALRMLNGRIRTIQASRLAETAATSVGDPLTEAGLPEALGLRRGIASNQEHAYAVSLYLTHWASTAAELAGDAGVVADAGARSLARVLPATFEMTAARAATLPLGVDPLLRHRTLPGAALASMYPWVSDELRQSSGRLVGFRRRGGSPILLDTFDESRFGNANIGVFGHSGSGKTYLMKNLLLGDVDAGLRGFVIDPECEYGDVCRAAGGQWVELALGSGHSINVLDASLARLGERDPLGDQVSDLLELLGTMCGALGDEERSDLDQVLRQVLQRGQATLRDVRAELAAQSLAPRVARALRRWTEGPLGDLFSAPTNVDFDAPLVVFGIRDLKEELLPVAYFLIAQWIWARVRSDPRPRRLLFDEVGLMFEHPPVRRFLVRLARRVRKYQGSLCLVTQNAGDLLGSDQGLVLATNPATLFLGYQRQAEAQRLQRAFGLSDSQADFLSNARRGDFLLLAGESRHRLRVAAPPWIDSVLRPGL